METMFDKPEIKNQLIERLQEIGFDMQDWHINTFHACEENHHFRVGDDEYDSYDYIYVINKNHLKDVFYLWVDVAWTEGMKSPVLYICTMHGESVDSDIEPLDGNIEKHFNKKYLESRETKEITDKLIERYSLQPVPPYKKELEKHVTPSQFEAIMQQDHYQKINSRKNSSL